MHLPFDIVSLFFSPFSRQEAPPLPYEVRGRANSARRIQLDNLHRCLGRRASRRLEGCADPQRRELKSEDGNAKNAAQDEEKHPAARTESRFRARNPSLLFILKNVSMNYACSAGVGKQFRRPRTRSFSSSSSSATLC